MRRCDQELCPMWDGDGCPCATFGFDRDHLPADGVFTVTWPRDKPEEVNAMPQIERCGSCGGVINPQTGECRCSD